MKVLGIRVDPTSTRYALVESSNGQCQLINAADESRLLYPTGVQSPGAKTLWLHRELERLFREHPDIEKVCIKTNEFGLIGTKANRESAYLEGAALLFCAQHDIPVAIWTYNSLGTKSSEVKYHAENRVGKTAKYWDTKIADAIVAAWRGGRP